MVLPRGAVCQATSEKDEQKDKLEVALLTGDDWLTVAKPATHPWHAIR